MLRILIVFVSVALVSCHPYFRDRIPNGYSVPNPCGSGIWEAVGHFDPAHHTQLKNQFGQDFAAAGFMWTAALCAMDSDGDGNTNGEELGDPGCTWTQGTTPSGSATGHPGICNPVGSCSGFYCGCHGHNCLGKWLP